jgi:ribosomal protein S7
VRACYHEGAITHVEPREEGGSISRGHQHPSAPVEVHEHSQISTNVLLPKCRKKE